MSTRGLPSRWVIASTWQSRMPAYRAANVSGVGHEACPSTRGIPRGLRPREGSIGPATTNQCIANLSHDHPTTKLPPYRRSFPSFWPAASEFGGRYLRVITLADRLTIDNAFLNRVQTVKLNYYPDTDSLYIDLSARPSAESRQVSEGVVLDYDEDGNLVGIDMDNASKKLDLSEVVTSCIPCA